MWAFFSKKIKNCPKLPNKWQDSPTVHFLSSNEINDYDKLAAVFRTDLTVFYDLYIDDRGLEDFLDYLEECKSQGCTTFICFELSHFESSARTNSCVLACKEDDESKLSQFVEQIQKRNDPNDYQILQKIMSKNDELRRFLVKCQAEEYSRFDINLNRSPPKLNIDISVQSKKQNIAIAQKAKHLKLFISERLAYPVLSNLTADSPKLVQETTSVLNTNLKKLVNGTPPNDIKEAYKAVLFELHIFHQNRYYFLRNSSNTTRRLSNLEETLNFVTTAIKCLNYGMKDGNWCVFGADQIANTVEEAVINEEKQSLTTNTFPTPLQTEDQSFLHDPVEEAVTNNDSEKLNKLNENIDAVIKCTADPSLRVLPEHITALDAAEVELTEMPTQEEPDDHYAAVEKLKNGQTQPQAKLNTTMTKRETEAVKNHKYLSSLIREGHELLVDSSADPTCFENFVDKIQRAMNVGHVQIVLGLSEGSQSLVEPMADIIPVAEAVKEAIIRRYNLYFDFVKERDNANKQLDGSRQILDAFENETAAALRPLDVAEQAMEALKNTHANLHSQAPILERLQKLSEELDPLDSVYADMRFVESDWDQLNQQFENVVTAFGDEIAAEQSIRDGFENIVAQIELLEEQLLTSKKFSLIKMAERTIPALETKLDHLAETETDGGRDRRYGARTSIPEIHARLDLLTVNVIDRINQMKQEPSLQPAASLNTTKNKKSGSSQLYHSLRPRKTGFSFKPPTQEEDPAIHEKVQSELEHPVAKSTPLVEIAEQVQQPLTKPSNSISQTLSKPVENAVVYTNTQAEAQCNRHPTKTVVILGRSNEAKLSVLKSMCCVLQNETFEAATSQTTQTDISEMPEDHIIQHEADHIRFVNIAVDEEDYKNADIIGSKLSEYPEIHGIITVISNNDSTLPDAQYNQLCFTYKLLFRNAFNKCCIVNVFKPNDTFNLDAASAQLMQFLENFCERHRLPDLLMNFFCVDAASMQSIHNVNLDETQRDLSRNAWRHVSNGLKGFLEVIETDKPLKARSFHLTAKLRRLENWLNIRRRKIPTPPPVEWRFLLEMVADSLMTGLAIYYRKKVGNAASLTNDELQTAVRYWQATDADVAKILLDIKQQY